jgi:hypothetical protein
MCCSLRRVIFALPTTPILTRCLTSSRVVSGVTTKKCPPTRSLSGIMFKGIFGSKDKAAPAIEEIIPEDIPEDAKWMNLPKEDIQRAIRVFGSCYFDRLPLSNFIAFHSL